MSDGGDGLPPDHTPTTTVEPSIRGSAMHRPLQALSAVLLATTTSTGLEGTGAGDVIIPFLLGEALMGLLAISLAEVARTRAFGEDLAVVRDPGEEGTGHPALLEG